MNRFLALMVALFLVVAAVGCLSDIVLEPEAPLKGTYEGIYSYITDYRNTNDEVIVKARVIFIFDETAYHMDLDTAFEADECFCSVDGQYALTEGVRLKESHSRPMDIGNCGGHGCNAEMNPEGTYVRETKGDSLILKFQEGTTLQMLRLLKISD